MIKDFEQESDTLLPLHREENISRRILTVRGHSVILDSDLAALYLVSTSALNQAVKRNAGRFPEDFVFRLTAKEKEEVVTKCDHLSRLKFSPVLPFAYTEHGTIRKRVWYPAISKAGLRRRTMYQTRHTFASLMLGHGEDPLWVARMLGHTSLDMIIKHYGKFIRNRSRKDGGRFLAGLKEAEACPRLDARAT
jgi:hypothetical protein